MSAVPIVTCDHAVEISLEILEEVFGAPEAWRFAVRMWDGTATGPGAGQAAQFTLVLRHPGALRRMFSPASELSLGEAYIYGDYDVEGDMESAIATGLALEHQVEGLGQRLRLKRLLMRLPHSGPARPERAPHLRGKVHSMERDRNAVRYHYGLPSEFFALFLDPRMIYSAANFERPEEDLETAQERKLENICQALRLERGDRFLDIGCGWGGLMVYAAHKFGVKALGVTLSRPQAETARKRIDETGLGESCRVEVCDYRDLMESGGFDKIASVGMVEHVGAEQLPSYFGHVFRLLRRGGLFLNSGIALAAGQPRRQAASFVKTYVFPDGELEPIHEMLAAAEGAGFEVRSTENLRESYGRTLRHWVRRLEEHAEEACRLTDEATYRIWRMYMAGSAANFFAGRLNVFQTVLGSH